MDFFVRVQPDHVNCNLPSALMQEVIDVAIPSDAGWLVEEQIDTGDMRHVARLFLVGIDHLDLCAGWNHEDLVEI